MKFCLVFFLTVLIHEGLTAQKNSDLLIHATRIDGQITVDGILDESDWNLAPVISGFRQVEPNQGEPASFDTEVQILYNDEYIFIGARLYDKPGQKPRVATLNRNFSYFQNDLFGVVFDTFNNERDAISFQVTPYGSQSDLEVFNDAIQNQNYDVVWFAETQINHDGWTVEIAIPWSSIRYSKDNDTWGINFVRRHRRSNEETAWAIWPRAYSPYRTEFAGKLTGLQAPPPSMNLRVQPYVLLQSDRMYDENNFSPEPKIGGEIKWAPSRNSVLDVTFNTDFAQAESDQQVVNLSRFPVVFPERRQFFLENANLFNVGRVNWLKPFFSRRIGLTPGGEPVPIDAGFRFTEQNSQRSIGALVMRQRSFDEFSPAWFGVARYIENFGNNKRVGFMATARHDEAGDGLSSSNNITGNIDTFMRFPSNITFAANLGGTYDQLESTWGHAGDFWISYLDNFIYIGLLQAVVSSNYLPRTGFVSRRDIIMTSPAVTFNWRPEWRPSSVRAFSLSILTYFYHKYSDLSFEQGFVAVRPFVVDFNSGARFQYSWLIEWQDLQNAFSPAGISVAAGNYQYQQHEITFNTDTSARAYLTVQAIHGGFYDGRYTMLRLGTGLRPIPNIAIYSFYTRNQFRDLGVESADRNLDLITTSFRLALNPRLQLAGSLQHNTEQRLNLVNLRFTWEFSPLSYLYLVFNDVHPFGDDLELRPPGQQQAIFKLTYLKQI